MSHKRVVQTVHAHSSNVILHQEESPVQNPDVQATFFRSDAEQAPDPETAVGLTAVDGAPFSWPAEMARVGANPSEAVQSALDKLAAEGVVIGDQTRWWFVILPAGVPQWDVKERVWLAVDVVDGGALAERRFWRPFEVVL